MLNKTKHFILLLSIAICCSNKVTAQAGSYSFTAVSGTYTPIIGTPITMTGDLSSPGSGPYDNGYANNIPIGFSFLYLGVGYSALHVSTEGYIGLNSASVSYPLNSLATIGIPTPRPILAPLWDDHNLNSASNIQYLTSGAAGSRVFVVQWSNVFWDKNASSAVISFQLRLYETTGVIEFVYSQLPGTVSATSGGASIGITNLLGGAGNFISLSNSSSAPGTSSVTETSDILVPPATGQVYKFTPVNCTSTTTIAVGNATTSSVDFSWAPVSGATEYEWAVTQSAVPPASGTLTATTSSSVSGLTPDQRYYIHVKTRCGVFFSGWTTTSFSTVVNDVPCNAITLTNGAPPICSDATFASSGGGEPSTVCSTPVTNTVWFKYTATTTGKTLLRFTRNGLPPGQFDGVVALYRPTSTCPFLSLTPPTPGNCMGFVNLNSAASADVETNNLTAGTTYYFMVRGTGKFCIEIPCTYNITPAPGTFGLAIPGGQVSFSWAPMPAATSYNLRVTGSTTTVTNVTGTSVTLAGFNYSTSYSWYVEPVTASGATLGCSSTATIFSTAAAPVICTPVYSTGCSAGDSIAYFSLKGAGGTVIYNQSGNTCNPQSYNDYTGVFSPVQLVAGESFSGFIRTGNSNDYFSLWIDYNDNGVFSSNERLVNNMRAGPATKHFTLFFPHPGVPFTGTHRMRVRVVNYSSAPFIHALTDPCNSYTFGETEDYLVSLSNSGTTRFVANGTPGTCTETNMIIDQHSNNIGGLVFLVDSSNNYIAAIDPGGNNLGIVQGSFYINNGPVRQDITGRYYLDRNLTVNTSIQPTSPYNFRMYYKNSELNALIAQPGSGVAVQSDLRMTKSVFPTCMSGFNGWATLYTPSVFGSSGGDGYLDLSGLTSFSSFYIHGGTAALLPVELLRFSGIREGSVNKLKWTTATEQNNRGFAVQRSSDGINYVTVSFVASRAPGGNSIDALDYVYIDNAPPGIKQYYRLQQTDHDGRSKYSQVIVIKGERPSVLLIQNIYPNPAGGIVNIETAIPSGEQVQLQVTDLSGRIIMRQYIKLEAGSNTIQLNTRTLAAGSYLIKLVCANCGNAVGKFVKY